MTCLGEPCCALLGTLRHLPCERAAVLDAAALANELNGSGKLCGIGGRAAEKRHELLSACGVEMLERPHHGERPLALGDVRAEVLPLGPGVSHEVEQVVGQLEGDAGGEPHLEQAARRLLRSAAHERAHVERHGGGVP